MKYIQILFFVFLCSMLTSCFSRPAETQENTVVPEEAAQEVDAPEETPETSTGGEVVEEENNENEQAAEREDSTSETPQDNTQSADETATGEVKQVNEDEIIEEYEQELEQLFNDILGENG